MALTAAEEALVRELIAQNPELLSLAGNEATIISKLGATKKNLSQLAAALSLNDTDLLFTRQGTSDKSVVLSVLKSFLISGIPAASTTVSGIVGLATSAEAQAFTANKFIDGAKLSDAFKGYNVSLAANGYQKLPSGLIIQWGTATTSASAGVAVNFPIQFPNSLLLLSSNADSPNAYFANFTSRTTSGFNASGWNMAANGARVAVGFLYLAIGF